MPADSSSRRRSLLKSEQQTKSKIVNSKLSLPLRYAYSKVPVVVTDALVNWSAPAVFSFDYFRRVYLGTTGEEGESDNNFRRQGATRTSCQFFPYRTEFRSLEEALRMAPERAHYNGSSSNGSSSNGQTAAPWYIGW